MFTGILLTLLTGLLWTGVAVSLTKARRSRCHVESFYLVASVAGVLCMLAWLFLSGQAADMQWSGIVCASISVGALFNALANTCIMLNMGRGNAALYFALSRMGFAISFLWSVLVWHEDARWVNFIGILCLIAAVALTAFAKAGTADADVRLSHRRLFLALGSTLCSGCSQICMIFPSSAFFAEQNLPTLPAPAKTGLVFLVNILFFGVSLLIRRPGLRSPTRPLYAWGLIWTALAIGSYAALFAALGALGTVNRTGIAFPVGGAVQIFFFAFIARVLWHERLNALQMTALVLVVLGVVAVHL